MRILVVVDNGDVVVPMVAPKRAATVKALKTSISLEIYMTDSTYF